MATEIQINIGSSDGMLPDGTKPLPELMLTYHERCSVTFNWEQFHKKKTGTQSETCVGKLHLKIIINSANELRQQRRWKWVKIFPLIARFMGTTWGPPGSCRPQVAPCRRHGPPPFVHCQYHAPVPLTIFRSNSKFDQNWERSSFKYT